MAREEYINPERFLIFSTPGEEPTIPSPPTLRKWHKDFLDTDVEMSTWARNLADGKLFYRGVNGIEEFPDLVFGPAMSAYHDHDSSYIIRTGDIVDATFNFDSGTLYIDNVGHFIGIGTETPLRKLHLSQNEATGHTIAAFEDINTTNGNGPVVSFRTTTTGGGGAAFQELAGYQVYFQEHNHATRRADLYFFTVDSGTERGWYFRGTGATEFPGDLSSTTFVSGFAGEGWKVDEASGEYSLTVDNLYVRKTMNVYELVINQIRASNGSFWVTDTAKVVSVALGKCYIDTDDGSVSQPFVANDIIRCQRWTGRTIKYYTAEVTSVDAGGEWFAYTVIDGTDAPEAGDIVVRVGNNTDATRQGSLYLTSSDSDAPYMDVMDGVTDESFAGKVKVRIGKLTGITDADFGGALTGYGMYSENVYLKGAIVASSGEIGGWTIDTDAIYVGSKKTTAGYTDSGITLAANGSLRSQFFEIQADGRAKFESVDSIFNSTPAVVGDLDGTVTTLQVNVVDTTPNPWDYEQNYYINDTCSHLGVNYIAIAPSLNEEPPNATFWDVDLTDYSAKARKDKITVSGTSGDAIVICDNSADTYLIFYDSIETTVRNYFDAYEAYFLSIGVYLTYVDDELFLEATTPGVDFVGATLIANDPINDLGSMRIDGNEIYIFEDDTDTGSLFINKRGSGGGYSKYRSTYICDGKNGFIIGASGLTGVASIMSGKLSIPGIPSSSAGLTAGRVWRDGTTLKIVT